MLIDNSINPDLSIYVLWWKLINLIKSNKKIWNKISVELLHSIFIDINSADKINLEYFIYILDWLFILWLIENDYSDNKIKICF